MFIINNITRYQFFYIKEVFPFFRQLEVGIIGSLKSWKISSGPHSSPTGTKDGICHSTVMAIPSSMTATDRSN